MGVLIFCLRGSKNIEWQVNGGSYTIYEIMTIPVDEIKKVEIKNFKSDIKDVSKSDILLKTLGFTYLNPHVYSDTVFFLGNFSKNFILNQKISFGIGASIASFLFFFLIGYLSKYLSKYAQIEKIWKIINIFIIVFMSFLTFFVFLEIVN